ncbi:MAG: T9SS type A sorting domain-containing protein [Bacteroidia bacterium]|nr:T9SS type A sorting domain-containing protein [Bacteroidia bacterium]
MKKIIISTAVILALCTTLTAQENTFGLIKGFQNNQVQTGLKSGNTLIFGTEDTTYLPDGTGASYFASFIIDAFPSNLTITDTNQLAGICANMEHSYLGDLIIQLICPSGQTMTLIPYPSGCGGTFLGEPIDNDMIIDPGVGYEYCWTPLSTNGTFQDNCGGWGTTLPSGDYEPLDTWTNLLGCSFNGTWALKVTDNLASDNGFIFGWWLEINMETIFSAYISGSVYNDLNDNCLFDSSDYPVSNAFIELSPGPFYVMTNQDGMYHAYLDTGAYLVKQVSGEDNLWTQQCPDIDINYSVTINSVDDSIIGLDFANTSEINCPDLSIDIATTIIRPCSTSVYTTHYENNGTIPAVNSYIEIELPQNVVCSYAAGQFDSYFQNQNIVIFNLGILSPGESGQFSFCADIPCDMSLLGSTMCVEAHIYPDTACLPVDSVWDHSSIAVQGECVADSLACFTIYNTGDPGEGDMDGYSQYRIYVNNEPVYAADFQISGGDSLIICWSASGNTIRLEADQRPGHPGNSQPQDNVEMCGDSLSAFVTGQILLTPLDDIDDFVEIDCHEVTGSIDPNDKQTVPVGLEESHLIDTSDALEYQVRFQNTGTDTAFNIVIFDTISQHLDITTLQPGVASHYYEIHLHNNTLYFMFPNIQLPDSNINEPTSHGFVKFNIKQQPGLPKGTVIENRAGIVFDYNEPVFTNTTFNTVWDLNQIITSCSVTSAVKSAIKVYPNPFKSVATFEIQGAEPPFGFVLQNVTGQIVTTITAIQNKKFVFNKANLARGIYLYKISNKAGFVDCGKIAIY